MAIKKICDIFQKHLPHCSINFRSYQKIRFIAILNVPFFLKLFFTVLYSQMWILCPATFHIISNEFDQSPDFNYLQIVHKNHCNHKTGLRGNQKRGLTLANDSEDV